VRVLKGGKGESQDCQRGMVKSLETRASIYLSAVLKRALSREKKWKKGEGEKKKDAQAKKGESPRTMLRGIYYARLLTRPKRETHAERKTYESLEKRGTKLRGGATKN